MIQKYKLVKEYYEDSLGDIRCTLMPDPYGEYVKYSDFVKETETLRDYNFKLQEQCSDLYQTKEDLINVIVGLNSTLSKKESELTVISDKLNQAHLKIQQPIFFIPNKIEGGDNHIRSRLL